MREVSSFAIWFDTTRYKTERQQGTQWQKGATRFEGKVVVWM